MDFKLKNNFLLLSTILVLSITTSCGVSKELRKERNSWQFSKWEQYFKKRTLCLCIIQGLNNKNIQDSIIKLDKSFYDPLSIAVFDTTINELLKNEIKQIQIDSLNSIGRYPADISNLLEGKRVFNHCINLYNSKKLDSVVQAEKKSWKKINNIIDKIHDKIPTF